MTTSPAVPVAAATFDTLPVPTDRGEILRYLGYPAGVVPDRRVAARIDEILAAAPAALRPRGTYAVYEPSARDRRSLTFSPGLAVKGAVADFLRPARRFAVFLVTAGPEISRRVDAAWNVNDALAALVWDAVGSHGAEGAADALAADLRARIGPDEALTLRYSPGYCGMDLAQQQVLFALIDPKPVGVTLLPTLIMDPIKSVSGIYGIGPADAVETSGSPCARCAMQDCRMRR